MKGLSFGKKTAVATPAGNGASAAQGTALWLYFLPGIVVSMLLVVVLVFLTLQLLGGARDDLNQREAKLVADTLAERIDGVLDARLGQLQLLSKGEDVQQALQSGDAQTIQSVAEAAGKRLPDVLQLRLFPIDVLKDLKPDPSGDAPLGYAGVDMVRRALTGEPSAAEIHQITAGTPYLAMVLPVRRSDAVIGAVFAAWPVSLLTRVTAAAPEFAGEFQLLQGDMSGYVIASSGSSEPFRTSEGSRDVNGSIWQLVYRSKPGDTGGDFSLLMGITLGGLIALLLALFLQVRLFSRDLRLDMATLVNLGEGIRNGKAGANPAARVAVSRDAILLLSEYARNSQTQRKSAKGASAASAPGHDAEPFQSPGLATDGILVEQEEESAPQDLPSHVEIDASIFRAYDVRGVVGKSLNADVALVLGRAFAEEALKQNAPEVCVAHDARLSSPELYQSFCDGLVAQGMQVVQLGQAPVALPYYYMHTHPNCAAVMVTGSHNPPDYNGFKLYINAVALQGDQLHALYQSASRGDFAQVQKGNLQQRDLGAEYLQVVSEQTQVGRPLKVVVDGGNGAAGELACDLLQAIGCDVVPLFCEPDGSFPNHHPDPNERDNLTALQLEVQAQEADLGIAFDGDGDRLGMIDNAGNYVWPEHLLMVLSSDILQRHPGTDVVFDVKSSRNLAAHVLANGGRPIMARSGHTRMKEKMRETGALLGGEFAGHFFIKERWYGSDDAIYAAARLLEALSSDPRPLDQVVGELPSSPATPEYHMPVPEDEVQPLMQRINASADFADARLVTLDGLRVEFTHGWGLVRASNTTPSLTFRFEADSDAVLQEIQQKFRDLINQVLPTAQLPF